MPYLISNSGYEDILDKIVLHVQDNKGTYVCVQPFSQTVVCCTLPTQKSLIIHKNHE